MYDALDQQLLLAARAPSRLQRRLANCVMAGLLAIFCVTAPYAALPLQPVAAFIPVYATTMVIVDLIIAATIFAQFWVVHWTWLLVLASGFLFAALMALPFALTFPGAFAPSGLLGANAQTASWLAVCWHIGSPLIVISAMLVRNSRQTEGAIQRAPGLAIILSIALVSATVWGLTWFVLAYDQLMPRIHADRYPGRNNLDLFVLMIGLSAVALALLWVRGRSVLDLWLRVLCSAWIFKLGLAGIFAGYIHNPNVAGATILSLGCQHTQVSMLKEELKKREKAWRQKRERAKKKRATS